MNSIKSIRGRLAVTQEILGKGIGCTQANVGHYEKGQTVPPEVAKRLIQYAASLGHVVTLNEIYDMPEPGLPSCNLAQAPAQSMAQQGA